MTKKETPPPSGDNAPASVVDLANACVRFVKNALGFDLDYSPETLPVLDHYVRLPAQQATLDADASEQSSEELRVLLISIAGAYFGEVVRRNVPEASWRIENADDYASFRIDVGADGALHFNPMAVAAEVIDADDVEGWNGGYSVAPALQAAARELLERTGGEVSSDDYYRFAVRYEVLEQLVALVTEGRSAAAKFN